MVKTQWYGCPYCSSSDYQRYQEDDMDQLRIWFSCRSCRRTFYQLLLWWIPAD